jgi:membrane associated rhomboid family serine protease
MDFTTQILIVLILAQGLLSFNDEAYEKSIFHVYKIKSNREYHRLLSCGFIHSGWLHLFVNAFAIYNFSPLLVEQFGSPLTLVFFILSILGSSLVMWWMKRNQPNYQALGASGGVSGLVMLVFFLNPNLSIGIFLIPIALPAYVFGILFSVVSLVLTFVKNPQHIAHEGHLGGLLTGGIIGVIYQGFPLDGFPTYALFWTGIVPIIFWLFTPPRKSMV